MIASNVGDMGRFHLRDEGALWASEIVDAARHAGHRCLAVILGWVTSTEWGVFGRLDSAMRYARESVAVSERPDFDVFVWCYADHAQVAMLQGDFELCAERARAGAAHPDDRHDRFCISLLGYFLAQAGKHDEAMRVVDSAIALTEAAGVPYSVSCAYYSKGLAFAHADPQVAIAAFERAIAVANASGDRFWEICAVSDLAALQARAGNPAAALSTFRRMLDAWQGLPDTMIVRQGIGGIIVLFERLSRFAPAVTLHAALMHFFPALSMPSELTDAIVRMRTALGEAAFAAASAQGEGMELRDATEFARAEVAGAMGALSAR